MKAMKNSRTPHAIHVSRFASRLLLLSALAVLVWPEMQLPAAPVAERDIAARNTETTVSPWRVTSRKTHENIWERNTSILNPVTGEPQLQKHTFTELGIGAFFDARTGKIIW